MCFLRIFLHFMITVFFLLAASQTTTVSGQTITVTLLNGVDIKTVLVKETLQLLCLVESTPAGGSFRWTHEASSPPPDNGLPRDLSSNTRVTIIEGSSSMGQPSSILNITDVAVADAGTYRCHYVNSEELIASVAVHVAFIPTPQCFRNEDTQGNLQRALCQTELAYPNVTVQWEDRLNGIVLIGAMAYTEGSVSSVLNVAGLPAGTDINNVICSVRNIAFPVDSYNTCNFHLETTTATTAGVVTEKRTTNAASFTTTRLVSDPRRSTSSSPVLQTDTRRPSTVLQTTTPVYEKIPTGSTKGLTTTSTVSINLTDVMPTTKSSSTMVSNIPSSESTGDGDGGIFGMFGTKEIIIAGAAGGAGLIVLGVAIICCVRVHRRRRKKTFAEKFARTDISYDTSYLSENSPTNQAFVADTFGSTEYYVLDKMKELEKEGGINNASNTTDLNSPPAYAAIDKTNYVDKLKMSPPKSEVSSVTNLYDSVTEW